jgi:hypothetical protein
MKIEIAPDGIRYSLSCILLFSSYLGVLGVLAVAWVPGGEADRSVECAA